MKKIAARNLDGNASRSLHLDRSGGPWYELAAVPSHGGDGEVPGAPLPGDPAASPGGALHGASGPGDQICFGSGSDLCGSANLGLLSEALADACACQKASDRSHRVTLSVHKAGCHGNGILAAHLGRTVVICKKAFYVAWSVHKE